MDISFIGAENELHIWVILFAIIAVSFWAEKYPWGRKIGSTIMVIILGFILGNVGFLPSEAGIYKTIWTIFVPLAIPLLLFQADIRKIVKESGPTLIAFLIGAVGTVLGAVIAFFVIALPDQAAELAGIFAATYIGGGVNFVAVSQSLGVIDSSLLLAATAADNIITILFLFVLAMLPAVSLLARQYPEGSHDEGRVEKNDTAKKFTLSSAGKAILALIIAFFFVTIGRGVEQALGWNGTAILITTALTLVFATFAPNFSRAMGNAYDLGMILMLVFFATLGASANLQALISTAPILLVFALIVVAVHFVFLFALAKFTKLTLPELIIGSNACILGAPTAAGLAAAKGWKNLVTPGILVGTLGYAIGNFIGVGLARFLS